MNVKYSWVLIFEDGKEFTEHQNKQLSKNNRVDPQNPIIRVKELKAIPNNKLYPEFNLRIPKAAKPVFHELISRDLFSSDLNSPIIYRFGWRIKNTRIMTTINTSNKKISLVVDEIK